MAGRSISDLLARLIALRRGWPWLLAVSLCAVSLAAFWPGVAMYDSVAQYRQAIAGQYDDWHPPAMALLWSLFGARGTAPMFAVQMALYWLGFGSVVAALAHAGRHRAAVGVIAVALSPVLLGWQMVVLKDTQMLGALIGATGIAAWWRMRGAPMPGVAVGIVVVLIGYAMLVRANAVFAAVPMAIGLIDWPCRLPCRIAAGIVAIGIVLGVAPIINHDVLGAEPSGVERTQALYDLAGIAVHVPESTDIGLTRAEARAVIARHCWSPFFWDPLGDDRRCASTLARLRQLPVGTLYKTLALAALHHPLAYAGARLAHLDSTERWLVPIGWPGAAPPAISEPNDLHLGDPGRAALAWQEAARLVAATPLAWPIVWVVVAVAALAVGARDLSATGRLGIALLASALTLEASFAIFSIASDLRYHLWPMVATMIGVILITDRRWPPLAVRGVGAALLIVIGAGTAARMLLPAPPQTYAGMLTWSANASINPG